MKNNQRLFIAIFISFLLHCIFIFVIVSIKQLPTKNQKKVKLENLLVLKRGQSLDPSKKTQEAKKPSLASQNTPHTPPAHNQNAQYPSHQTLQNKNPLKEQSDSQKNSLKHSDSSHFDPKNLSLLNQEMQPEMQNLSSHAIQENDKGKDPQTIQEIDELYGEEFGDLGNAQKDFIRNNLRNIGRITQQYLSYPRVAAYFEQSGINAVEFYLHPNGDITDLKIIKSSGLKSFDNATLNTIKIAYKDYPRPQQKTLIRIKVTYSYFGF